MQNNQFGLFEFVKKFCNIFSLSLIVVDEFDEESSIETI